MESRGKLALENVAKIRNRLLYAQNIFFTFLVLKLMQTLDLVISLWYQIFKFDTYGLSLG